ncbi:MAG: ABC transporter ATP-binding protein [Lachnospiraceae bacterium]
MLKIKNLEKTFGKYHALSGLNLEIPKGALFGFVGPNGAGKTTTIKIICGLLAADAGTVTVDGYDIRRDADKVKGMIGYVPDYFGVYDNLKVSEYMEFFASCYGLDGLKARTRIMTLLEQVGLEDRMDFYVDGLSRGMKQRLCLARALIHDPRLLILDEPTSGMDPRSRFDFKEIIKELHDQEKTVMISSHLLSELSEVCTDLGVIDEGHMVLGGSMQDILERVDNSRPLVITINGTAERAMAILRSHPNVQTIAVKNDEIMVGFIGDREDEAQLLQQLVDAEVLVCGFYRVRGDLETLFMQITEKEEKAVLIHEG